MSRDWTGFEFIDAGETVRVTYELSPGWWYANYENSGRILLHDRELENERLLLVQQQEIAAYIGAELAAGLEE